jgi:hypothetical protein
MNVTQKYYFDQPEHSEWYLSFKVLMLKRDHRRILNRRPEIPQLIIFPDRFYYLISFNFKILAN